MGQLFIACNKLFENYMSRLLGFTEKIESLLSFFLFFLKFN